MVSFILSPALSQNYIPIPGKSSVKFYINNFGLSTEGSLSGLKANIVFNPNNLENASVEVSVDASTVFTKNRLRDNHLKSEDYFYVEKYPAIYLISTNITRTEVTGLYLFEGNLLMKGITKFIKFPFKAIPEKSGYVFNGDFNLKRSDFLIGKGSLVLSNHVLVTFSVSTIKK
jgi:polyisoprenoid-binding protein YceI